MRQHKRDDLVTAIMGLMRDSFYSQLTHLRADAFQVFLRHLAQPGAPSTFVDTAARCTAAVYIVLISSYS